MSKSKALTMFVHRMTAISDQEKDDKVYLGIAIRVYRSLKTAIATAEGKRLWLRESVIALMIKLGLEKFVVARTEANLSYEIVLPNGREGSILSIKLLRLMEQHGVFSELPAEQVLDLIQKDRVTTTRHSVSKRGKEIIRENPELMKEVTDLLGIKPRLSVGPITQKTREGK